MATMHDILDAQWMYDNYKDGNKKLLKWFNDCYDYYDYDYDYYYYYY